MQHRSAHTLHLTSGHADLSGSDCVRLLLLFEVRETLCRSEAARLRSGRRSAGQSDQFGQFQLSTAARAPHQPAEL